MKSHPAGLWRPTDIVVCSLEEASPSRWFGCGWLGREDAGLATQSEGTLESFGGSREEEGFSLRVFVGGLQGDGGGFGVIFERAIEEATRRRKGKI